MFSRKIHLEYSSPIPSNLSTAEACARLQDHGNMLRLNPLIAHWEQKDSPPPQALTGVHTAASRTMESHTSPKTRDQASSPSTNQASAPTTEQTSSPSTQAGPPQTADEASSSTTLSTAPSATTTASPADSYPHLYSWYSITDLIPLVHGLYSQRVTYSAGFLNTSAGVTTWVFAPMGLEIRETWSVHEAHPHAPPTPGADSQSQAQPQPQAESPAGSERESRPVTQGTGAARVTESVDVTCSALVWPFVRAQFERSHADMLRRLLGPEGARGQEGAAGQGG